MKDEPINLKTRDGGVTWTGQRYDAVEGSETGHCCFNASVIDNGKDPKLARSDYVICECFDLEHAARIAAALNCFPFA